MFYVVGVNNRNGFCRAIELIALFLLLFCGCQDGRPERAQVKGRVLIDGKPLAHGYVRFVPADGRASHGQLDASGHFTLTCFEKEDGAVLGAHRVEVSGMERINDWTTRWHAPKKYADLTTSEIVRTISEPTEAMLIELTWDGAEPFTEVDETNRPTRSGEMPRRGKK